MAKKQNTFVSGLMFFIYESTKLLPIPFETPYQWSKRTLNCSRQNYYANIFNLTKRGALKTISKNGKKFIQLTQKGQLEVLLAKAKIEQAKKWDGKWRVIIYDIPEDARPQRNIFRALLKQNNFIKLQASVFISPYALNRDAIEYLKVSGLIKYIRIIRSDGIDSDRDLRKSFSL